MTRQPDLTTNPNTHWASLFLIELALAGLRHVCFAPGSRSTPLVLAAAQTSGLQLHRHLDERSAGFFALGLAKACRRPVALVCTSGTAVANFHPAVIEACQSRIPLIVLTADRPPELRGSGANQTIDQLKLFGDHVGLFMEMPVPQEVAPTAAIRHLQTAAARVYAAAHGPVAGPVHVNFPFRKPLEPNLTVDPASASPKHLTDRAAPYTEIAVGRRQASAAQVEWLADLLAVHPDGLIVCGPNCPSDLAPAVAELSQLAGYPLAADPLSGLRFGPHVAAGSTLGGYDLLLQGDPDAWTAASVILRFGDVPTSAALNAYIDRCAPEATVHIREDGVWADDLHRVRHFWAVDEAGLCAVVARQLQQRGIDRADSDWLRHHRELEALTWREVTNFADTSALSDATMVRAVMMSLPAESLVFGGNSLPIRHIDALAQPATTPMAVAGNRGASGIDGNVSTAIGLAAGSGRPVVAILGDITFYHDMNGLLALRDRSVPPVTFVVLNNDGGGIFRRLPVAVHEPPLTDLFLTPHGLTFDHAAALYGLAYHRVSPEDGPDGLSTALDMVRRPAGHSLIEVITDGKRDWTTMQALINHLRTALAAHPAPRQAPIGKVII